MEEIFKRIRQNIVLVVKEINNTNTFHTIASRNSKHYYWTSIISSKYRDLSGNKLSDKDLPAALITSDNQKEYVLIKNLSTDYLLRILNSSFGYYGEVNKVPLSSIFQDFTLFPGKSQKFRNTIKYQPLKSLEISFSLP